MDMKRLSLIIITVILALAFGQLVMNYQERYEDVKGSVVLGEDLDYESLANAIVQKNYLPTEEDAQFAARHILNVMKSGEELESLYDMNKRAWRIHADSIRTSGSEYYQQQLLWETQKMGLDEEFKNLDLNSLNPVCYVEGNGRGQIKVDVRREKEPCAGVTVRLYEHQIGEDGEPVSTILAHARTNSKGTALFKGLALTSSYSVIPVKEGCEYGSSQGTVGGSLEQVGDDGCIECLFEENDHSIKVFDSITLRNIKSDHVMTVRSLDDFFMTMGIYVGLFFLAWWLLFFIYRRRNHEAPAGIIPVMMFLTGICMLMMFSMNDPLNDKLIGVDMAQGVLAGIFVMMLLQKVDFRAFYQDRCRIPFDIPAACIRWVFRPFGTKADQFFDRMPKGWGYMLVAVLLTLLLFTPLGVAVGGMRVNLNIGILFQPSEIAKYLIVLFMAAFFCANAEKIVKFSQKGNVDLFGVKIRMLAGILLGLGFLMGLYLLLGDMGPSMVLAFTFLIMYSVIKSKVDVDENVGRVRMRHILTCDLAMLVYGLVSFLLMLYVGSLLGCMWLFCLAWFVLWIVVGLIRRQFFESAFVFNLIIAAFIFGSSIMGAIPGLDSVAERLDSRNEMCTNTWGVLPLDGATADPGENTQVAEGLWGLASGGFAGQGIGEGSPNVIPAFHTDMILASIGEEFGFLGLLVLVVLLAILLRKTILTGYSTHNPFAFYLCLGVAVVTGVQFVIIALGSTGVIPLTGVTVPFLSFGKVSMILNLAAFGMVLSISALKPEAATSDVAEVRRRQMARYDYSVSLVSMIFAMVSMFILGVFLKYCILERDEILVRPVYVNNVSGMPVVAYNPRIAQVAEKMPIGNIYDRNGILLASSDAEEIMWNKDRYLSFGVDSASFMTHMKSRLKRYYPFGEHLFYMVGDYNTRLFFTSGNERGYLAEARHLSTLRGYDDRMMEDGEYVTVDLESDEYRPGKYFNNDSTMVLRGVQLRDYNVLLPALKSGEQVGTTPQDVVLTLDARLQTSIQNRLQQFIDNESNSYSWKNPYTGARSYVKYKDNDQLRISIVVLDAKSGDLLTSALYPLPDQKQLMSMTESELMQFLDLGILYPTQPGSTAKVMSSMAALISEDMTTKDVMSQTYYNASAERVGYEYTVNLDHEISMLDALKKSSNNYFINLVNDKNLYDELAKVYTLAGARLRYETPYTFYYDENYNHAMDTVMREVSRYALSTYARYQEKVEKTGIREPLKKHAAWQIAWGQGELSATPLAMARVASIVAGRGSMPVTRYLMDESPKSVVLEGMSREDASYLRYCMSAEAEGHNFKAKVYGKTGTAQRPVGKNANEQDGWYMGYCDGVRGPIAFAVRLERGPGSGNAVRVTEEVLIPALKQAGYIK